MGKLNAKDLTLSQTLDALGWTHVTGGGLERHLIFDAGHRFVGHLDACEVWDLLVEAGLIEQSSVYPLAAYSPLDGHRSDEQRERTIALYLERQQRASN